MTCPIRKFNEKPEAPATLAGRLWRVGAMAVLAASLMACQARIDSRGYVPTPEDLERIKAGVQGREEVREILGTPSSASNFTDDRWYYISKKTRSVAFFTPTVLEQNVVVVEFDDTGFVRDLHRYALEDGLIVDPVTRKTPSPGRELSFLEQLIGNFGKFNSPNNRAYER
jgi:outer membrane protein assembly factor BamE (lipoprotein component of BamABCDE complex)